VTTQVFPNLALAYGATPNLEISAGVSGSTSNVPVPQPLLRFNNPAVAAKWRYQEQTNRVPALALGYQATLNTQDTGFGRGYSSHSLWVTASRATGRGVLWGNVGANVSPRPGTVGNAFYGVVYDYGIDSRWRIGAQVYGNTSSAKQGVPEEIAPGFGVTYAFSARDTFLFQAGRSHKRNADLTVYAGILTHVGK
jgi:hypothetical protein